MSTGSDSETQRSRSVVEARRAQAYSMHLRGYNERRIAERLHVNQSTISRALEAKRRENTELFKNAEGRDLLRGFFQEERDRYLDLLQEEWNHYCSIPETDYGGRSRALSMIRVTLASMSHMAGRLITEIDSVYTDLRMDELEEYVGIKDKKQGPVSHPG